MTEKGRELIMNKELTNQEIATREWEKFQFENSAYSELKNWCEKYLPKNGYSIFSPVGDATLLAIYITDDAISTNFYFKKDTGEYYGGEYA